MAGHDPSHRAPRFSVPSVWPRPQLPIWGQGRTHDGLRTARGRPAARRPFHDRRRSTCLHFAHSLGGGVPQSWLWRPSDGSCASPARIAVRASAENSQRAELLGCTSGLVHHRVDDRRRAVGGRTDPPSGNNTTFSSADRGSEVPSRRWRPPSSRACESSVAVYAAVLISVLQESMRWSSRISGGCRPVSRDCYRLLAQRRTLIREQEASSWEANQRSGPPHASCSPCRPWYLASRSHPAPSRPDRRVPVLGEAGIPTARSFAAIIAMVLYHSSAHRMGAVR